MTKPIDLKDTGQSKPNQLNKTDLIRWANNLLKFTAPTLAIFFGQLAIGVEPKAAALVALLGLYGALSDLFSKYKEGK